jgi:hypothetical protein
VRHGRSRPARPALGTSDGVAEQDDTVAEPPVLHEAQAGRGVGASGPRRAAASARMSTPCAATGPYAWTGGTRTIPSVLPDLTRRVTTDRLAGAA